MSPENARCPWILRISASVQSDVSFSPRAMDVASLFGLSAGDSQTLYEGLELPIAPGEVWAVAGPSGAGKSVLLAQARRQCPSAVGLEMGALARSGKPAVDCVGGRDLAARLDLLSRCGLAEARAMMTPACRLSGGQRYRLALARAIARARRQGPPRLLVGDEFCSTLDDATAQALCMQVRRLARRENLAMLLATPRADVLGWLAPDAVVVKPLGEAARILRPGPAPAEPDWPVVAGTLADYQALASFHYLAGRPAAHKRVWVVRPGSAGRADGAPAVAAVLVVSPPLANVRGRNAATAGRYAGPDRAANLQRLNAEVECISRVIVHPIYRGCSLAGRLVRHAIATAGTPLVESLAAMGAVNPFLERAGMTAYPQQPDADAARLVSAAEVAGLTRRDLAGVEPVRRLLRGTDPPSRLLAQEVARAVRRYRALRRGRLEGDALAQVCRQAARQYVYYLARRES